MMLTDLSIEARTLADIFAACPVGEVVSYADLSAAIGRDVRQCRHFISTARRIALRDAAAVFVVERNAGYRRLAAEPATRVLGLTARKHIRKTAGRTRRALEVTVARANDLSEDAARQAAREISVLALLEHAARDRFAAAQPDAPAKPQPVAATARALLVALTGKDAAP